MWLKRSEGVAVKFMRATIPFVALLLIGLVYYLGVRSERSGFVANVIDPGLKRIALPVVNAFRGRPPTVPFMRLTVEEAVWDSLLAHMDTGPDVEAWPPSTGRSIPGTVSLDERRIPVLLSLNDDRHVQDAERPSIHLSVQGPDTLLGRQAMVLEPVRNERALNTWLLQEIMEDQGLPSFPVRFVEVQILEGPVALHALHARLDSLLLRSWKRGEGPVLQFDDELLRRSTAQMMGDTDQVDRSFQTDWMSAPIKIINPVPQQNAAHARRLRSTAKAMEELRTGTASALLDAQATGRLLALCDLFGAQAAIDWPNLFFLADSTNGQLMIVPYMGEAGAPITAPLVLRSGPPDRSRSHRTTFMDRLLGDTAVFSTYMRELERMTGPGWMEHVLARLGPAITRQLHVLRTEMPITYPDTSVFSHNRRIIRSMLHPADIALAYVHDQQGPVERIAVANVHSLPITIDAVINDADTIPLKDPVHLRPRQRDRPLAYARVELPLDLGTAERPRLLGHVDGTSEQRSIPLRTWISLSADP